MYCVEWKNVKKIILMFIIMLSVSLPSEARMVCTNYNGKRMCQMQDRTQLKFDLYNCMEKGFSEKQCIEKAKTKAFELSEKLDRVVTIRFTQAN